MGRVSQTSEEAERPCVLIAGLGSVGRRHLRNLCRLGVDRFVLLRSGQATLPDADLAETSSGATFQVETDMTVALAHGPQAAVVANPTSLHLSVAKAVIDGGCHLLVEKPLSHSLDGVDALVAAADTEERAALVGYQYRFSEPLRTVRDLLVDGAIGRVVHVSCTYAEYLPGMHPWEDFRQSCSARRELGGGVLLTLSHPVDYTRWLFGEIVTVSAAEAQPAPFGLNVDGCVDALLRCAGGVQVHLHLDFLQHPRCHNLVIRGETGTITWDEADNIVHWHDAASQQHDALPPTPGHDRNTMFLDEVRHFLDCVAGRSEPITSLADGRRSLAVLMAIRQATAEHREVAVS